MKQEKIINCDGDSKLHTAVSQVYLTCSTYQYAYIHVPHIRVSKKRTDCTGKATANAHIYTDTH